MHIHACIHIYLHIYYITHTRLRQEVLKTSFSSIEWTEFPVSLNTSPNYMQPVRCSSYQWPPCHCYDQDTSVSFVVKHVRFVFFLHAGEITCENKLLKEKAEECDPLNWNLSTFPRNYRKKKANRQHCDWTMWIMCLDHAYSVAVGDRALNLFSLLGNKS